MFIVFKEQMIFQVQRAKAIIMDDETNVKVSYRLCRDHNNIRCYVLASYLWLWKAFATILHNCFDEQ